MKIFSKRLLALTQLQPTDASRLLPCFDEPEMKASFHLTIIHPTGTSAISNSPISRLRLLNAYVFNFKKNFDF